MTAIATKTKTPATPPASFQRETLLSTLTALDYHRRTTGMALTLHRSKDHWQTFGDVYRWAIDRGYVARLDDRRHLHLTITDKGREWLRRQIRDSAGAVGGEGAQR